MKFRGLFPPLKQGGITEIYLYRMLLTSIFCILLCMGCLAGTTWAWFSVSVENTENVIQIGTPSVNVSVGEAEFISGSVLPVGDHMLTVVHANDMDAFEYKSILYATFSADEEVAGYIILNNGNGYRSNLRILNDKECLISWTVSWIKPETVDPLEGGVLDLRTEEEAAEETTQPTEPTTSTEATETQPAESTAPTETTATQPTESTAPTETTATQPTESTAPTETTATQPTESTAPTETTETQPVEPTGTGDPAVVSEEETNPEEQENS